MTNNEEYIYFPSEVLLRNLPIDVPNANGRYSVWIIIICGRNGSNYIDLDYIERLSKGIFSKYKVLMTSTDTSESENGKLVDRELTTCLLVGTTEIRKRYKTLINELDDYCDLKFRNNHLLQVARSTVSFLKFHPSEIYENRYHIVISSDKEAEYRGRDIRVLNNIANFHPWQKDVYKIIWNEMEQKFNDPDPRSIYWIFDPRGNTGKSVFVKWLCVNKPDDVVKVSFGTPNQLRSSLISAGGKTCYFIDIPRVSNKEDSVENLLTVIEDLKNGYLVSNFYGRYSSLIMEPPNVFIFSNEKCPKTQMSQDRWRSYKIDKDTLTLKNC